MVIHVHALIYIHISLTEYHDSGNIHPLWQLLITIPLKDCIENKSDEVHHLTPDVTKPTKAIWWDKYSHNYALTPPCLPSACKGVYMYKLTQYTPLPCPHIHTHV